jgi:hypothetical protein
MLQLPKSIPTTSTFVSNGFLFSQHLVSPNNEPGIVLGLQVWRSPITRSMGNVKFTLRALGESQREAGTPSPC